MFLTSTENGEPLAIINDGVIQHMRVGGDGAIGVKYLRKIQGAQFFAVAGKVYEKARAAGLGREIPTEWLLQDIRD